MRQKEQEAYGALSIMDTRPLIYEPSRRRGEMGLTYPAVEPRRWINRIPVSSSLQEGVTGVYNVSMGQADPMAFVVPLRPKEHRTGVGRPTMQQELIKKEQSKENRLQIVCPPTRGGRK